MRIAPIPAGKAVIYLYKNGFGRGWTSIAVNEKVETAVNNGGYYPSVVAPGDYSLEVGTGFDWTPMGTPVKTIHAEDGKDYVIEFLRFSGSFKEVALEQGFKDLKKTKKLLPFRLYDFGVDSSREVTD